VLKSNLDCFTLFFAEREDNNRSKIAFHDHFDNFKAIRFPSVFGTTAGTAPSFVASTFLFATTLVGNHGHRLGEVVLSKLAIFVDDKVNTITSAWENVVLERSRTIVRVDDMTRLGKIGWSL
jgi:hypothetical protein